MEAKVEQSKSQQSSSNSSIIKILVFGSVQGQISELIEKVDKFVSSKSGPFHFALCVGEFFKTNEESLPKNLKTPCIFKSLKILNSNFFLKKKKQFLFIFMVIILKEMN